MRKFTIPGAPIRKIIRLEEPSKINTTNGQRIDKETETIQSNCRDAKKRREGKKMDGKKIGFANLKFDISSSVKLRTFRAMCYRLIAAICLCGAVSGFAAETVGVGPSFKGPCGLVLYSVRDEMAHNPSNALDQVGKLGFRYVEIGGTRELSPATPEAQRDFLAQLGARNLKAVSCHFTFERFRDDIDGVIRDAQNLGVQYVCCAGISHQSKFDEKACSEGIAVFNHAGETLAKHHLTLCYHPHGFEFEPSGSGTLFDKLITETNPKFVSYEMDVFWIYFAGQDPVQLLKKYPKRWKLMHLKDMKKGDTPPKIDLHSSVALGSGQLNMSALLRAARREGVKYYFIEDESPDVLQQLPLSLAYLEQLKW